MATDLVSISRETARRFVLGKQGLWPGRRWAGKHGTTAGIAACEYVQLDPLQIVGRSHDLMLHGRVSGYQPDLFGEVVYADRAFFDWGGWLAVRPMHELPYWRVAMHRERQRPDLRAIVEQHGDIVREMRALLRERETVGRREIRERERVAVRHYRGSRDSALALYYLWRVGEAMTHHREGFERIYAAAERVAPADLMGEVDERLADQFFARKAVAFAGIGPIGSLSRTAGRKFGPDEQRSIQQDLVESGEIVPVAIDGRRGGNFVLGSDISVLEEVADGHVPRSWTPRDTTTDEEVRLLSPLDPVCARGRAKALFDFDYGWEIYKKPELVQFGRFAMPILWGDELVGRIDLRTDRKSETLVINGIWLEREPLALRMDFLEALNRGLGRLMAFLGASRLDSAAVRNHRILSVLTAVPPADSASSTE